jgi:hypothetical protein
MSPLSLEEFIVGVEPHPVDVVRDILQDVGSLSLLMEVHYLAKEPGLLEIMRGLVALSEEDRQLLQTFLVRDGHSVCVSATATGGVAIERVNAARLNKSA